MVDVESRNGNSARLTRSRTCLFATAARLQADLAAQSRADLAEADAADGVDGFPGAAGDFAFELLLRHDGDS